MDLPQLWFSEIRPSIGEDKKLDDDKNIPRVWISRVLYGASNHIIILTKNSFKKKISIFQKCLSTIFALLQKNARQGERKCQGERKKLQKMKVVLMDSHCWPLPIGYLTFQI